MNDSIVAKLRVLGTEVTLETVAATAALVAPLHAHINNADVKITRDVKYGPDDRNRLDVFQAAAEAGGSAPSASAKTSASKPVLVFVHGGGFIMGDKTSPNSPFYDNVGHWAAHHGMVGVNITYRLAPQHQWPAGSDDVSLAVKWVRENIAAHGGDASRVYVMGQSAGAVHVASYIAREFGNTGGRAPAAGWKPAGALLISGLYDTDTMIRGERFHAYFGNDESKLENLSFVGALAGTNVPLFVVLAELDPLDFMQQFVVLQETHIRRQVKLPRLVQLMGENHFTTVWQLGLEGSTLEPHILEFVSGT